MSKPPATMSEAPDDLDADPQEHTSVRLTRPAVLRGPESDREPESRRYSTKPPTSSEAPEAPEPTAEIDAATDSMLSRYFRDMATHQVMGPDEELQAAQDVERAEVAHWVALLSYLPATDYVVDQLGLDVVTMNEEERPDVPQIAELKKLLKVYRKQRSKLSAQQMRRWTDLCESLARQVRLPDSDRIWMANANRAVRDVIKPPPSTSPIA